MGEVFAGRYELLDLIGEGGMGSVWRVWDARTHRVVAAKVLKQSDAATLLRFVREQAVRIHHPHVVVPLGWAGEDDRVLFTMPIVRGGSVATLVADHGPLPPLLVAELLRQVLSGLTAVHAANIVHRDLKPANLLLDATGTARPHAYLSDFGIAVDLGAPRWTATGVVTGTPGYLAPEVESLGEVTVAADLYAVGQVAQTMLTGARPAQRGAAILRPADVPDPLWDVICALVAADPAQRPVSAGLALAALEVPELAWRPEAIGDVEVFDQLPADEPRPGSMVAGASVIGAGAGVGDGTGAYRDPATDNDRTVARAAPDGAGVNVDPTQAPGRAAATDMTGSQRNPFSSAASAQAPVLVDPADRPGFSGDPSPSAASGRSGPSTRSGSVGSSGLSRAPLVAGGVVAAAALVGLLVWSPWSGPGDPERGSTTSTTSSSPPVTQSSSTSPTSATSSPPSTGSSTTTPSTPASTTGTLNVNPVIVKVGQPCEFSDVGQRGQTTDGVDVVCTYGDGRYTWQRP